MSNLNRQTSYPLISNANEYMIVQKVVSIHSEDRNIKKYPSATQFEIELPEDYINVSTVKLGSYTFPANYNTFSLEHGNLGLAFTMDKIYNPADYEYYNELQDIIFNALSQNQDGEYVTVITPGFYSPLQIATELTNRLNETITNAISVYLNDTNQPELLNKFILLGGYDQFIVIYNDVKQTLWFGNKSSSFTIKNNSKLYAFKDEIGQIGQCFTPSSLPDFSNWGLPAYLGFTRCPVQSTSNTIPGVYPRFYYGDAAEPGDNGYWIKPDPNYKNKFVYVVETPAKINLMGNSYFYMEIEGLNNIDETNPFEDTQFTSTTNITNGRINSAFAKIAVSTTPVSQWYDANTEAIKIFNPPAERIRRIKVKLRYHDGKMVTFGKFPWSFNLIFNTLQPQQLKSFMTYNPIANSVGGTSSASGKR